MLDGEGAHARHAAPHLVRSGRMRVLAALVARRFAAASSHGSLPQTSLQFRVVYRYYSQQLHHPTAVIGTGAKIGEGVRIGPFCVVSERANIGPHCELGPGVHVLGDTTLGARCVIRSHAVIGAEVREMGDSSLHPRVCVTCMLFISTVSLLPLPLMESNPPWCLAIGVLPSLFFFF